MVSNTWTICGVFLESKADIVWPLSSPVVSSCVSVATEFLALALDNNNIIIWNNYFGEWCL